MRILQKEGPINHSSVAPPDGDNLLKSFFFIYKNRWDGAADTGLFTFSDKFAQRSAQKGWVRLELLNVNGKDIAGLLMLRYQDTISMYLMAVDRNYNKKVSIGNILTGLSIGKAVDDGFSVYDFLKGDEDYKFHWAKEGRRSLHFTLPQRGIGTILYTSRQFIKNLAKIAFK